MTRSDLVTHAESEEWRDATVSIDLDVRGSPVSPLLYGKFCEHLGLNVYHGMEAQILFNPVFGEWHFRSRHRRQSGGFGGEWDPGRIDGHVADHVRSLAYPESTDPEALLSAYRDGLAFGWLPTDRAAVRCSPDTGPSGDRAQRVQTEAVDAGIYQRTHLPAHRVRDYEFRCRIRAVEPTTVTLSLGRDGGETLATARIDAETEWSTVEGSMTIPAGAGVDEDGPFELGVTAPEPAHFVVERLLLYPGDHVDYADPEIVDWLRESDLPLLRWPGGNFVSGYDWRDGVGPVDDRPTRSNPAWHGLEYNLFGTAEFVGFCEEVGCEPSICVNAGDGTPEEAARWVEYCNGDPDDTEMGALRAEHGRPEPYDVTRWEIGNELYGRWQVRWTTPEGYADRYRRFREAMLEADPSISVTATGQETNHDGTWNDVLLAEAGETVDAISEHVLAGGRVDASTDPDELFRAFVGYSEQLGEEFRALRERMDEAGVDDPTLDVTELQLFATFQGDDGGADPDDGSAAARLSPETMPAPTTISEALYDATIRHELARLGDFVELLTHSATVNHGGGLRKKDERTWADPCYYGRSMTAALAGGTPVGVELECGTIQTDSSFGEIDSFAGVPGIDAFATIGEDEARVDVVLVNRHSADDPVSVTVHTGSFDATESATVRALEGETMYDGNDRERPERIVPESSSVPVEDGVATIELAPYSLVRVTFEGR